MITRSHCDAFPCRRIAHCELCMSPKKTENRGAGMQTHPIGPQTRRKIVGGVIILVTCTLFLHTVPETRSSGVERDFPAQSEQKTKTGNHVDAFRVISKRGHAYVHARIAHQAPHLGLAKITNRGQSPRFDQLSVPTSNASCSI